MKKFNKLLALLFVLAMAQYSFAQITGTAHDFSAASFNTTGQLCIVCHTPHNADVTVAEAPLWNHELSSVATYTVYSSTTLDANGGLGLGQPAATSKLCLSCHDGTVALENFGGTALLPAAGTLMGAVNGGTADVSSNLSNDHPISFTYDDALASTDGGLHAPSTTASGITGTIAADLLFAGNMECASCHDVHDGAGLGATGFLLVKSNAGSALCLTCHNK